MPLDIIMGPQSWELDLQAAQTWEDLPVEAQEYVQRIEAASGVPIHQISVGPEREQLIIREHSNSELAN